MTAVALLAVALRIDELPGVIEVKLAVREMVGAGPVVVTVTVVAAVTVPPAPVAVAV